MSDIKRPRKSESNYDFHNRWKKHIKDDHPELTKGINRGVLLGFCQLLADDGGHGVSCFTSDETLGEYMECSRDTVAKYKREALRLGWFVKTGEHGRYNSPEFKIAIPEHDTIPFDPSRKAYPGRKSNLGKHLNDGTKQDPQPSRPPWEDADSTELLSDEEPARPPWEVDEPSPELPVNTPADVVKRRGIKLKPGVLPCEGIEYQTTLHAFECRCKECR